MINEPSVEELVKKIGSRYGLCTVCAKRARQIIDQPKPLGEEVAPRTEKPITLAAEEILSGRVTATKD
ncbi:MAG: DNA-directed RNA polymerase subunit omega [Clostridiales bacterium]|nr:DNA-directed RNA polymerase subunit omega [Clostridiales bacterium]